ncbi:LysR substrate-binding domain-containing protein [Mesorhizobium sp. ANAO-SY3R2]|uniref:LysR substrate-binding domain-containing protein n=1 Tax=Mesorhizobium sp. ANAO-SY3R2 TaxID=3166644 RepID=UPI0036707496
MAERPEALPPLEWIRVYEAAARLGSFTAAAAELGLTQAAVSQRIRNLELRIGAQLFDRQARGVTLSTQGEAWLPHVQAALGQLAHSTANLFAAPRRKITIAASASIIELWIVPRLAMIGRVLPQLQLSFETIQRLPDYSRSEADFEIRFGEGNWPELEARRLFTEELAPVASPALLDTARGDWQSLPRIAVSGPRIGWRDWTAAMAAPPSPVPLLRFDTFVQSLRAAEAGAGVLLGSLALCREVLAAGRLVRMDDQALRMEAGYWITWPRSRPRFAERQALLDSLTSGGAD